MQPRLFWPLDVSVMSFPGISTIAVVAFSDITGTNLTSCYYQRVPEVAYTCTNAAPPKSYLANQVTMSTYHSSIATTITKAMRD